MSFFFFFFHLICRISCEKGNEELYYDFFMEKYQEIDKSIFFYNCYFKKDCEIFENALKKYIDFDDIYIEKVKNQSITNYFTFIYDENISISVSQIQNSQEITSILDFYLTDTKNDIETYNFSQTRYIKIIGPKNEFYTLKNMVMDSVDDFGFIDIVLAEEDYGYKFYNPFEKLFHSFDGSFYSFEETMKKQILPYNFREMIKSQSISLIIMNPDPSIETRESLYEIKNIFPHLSVVIPDNEAIKDINYLTNSSTYDIMLFHASLAIYSGTTFNELNILKPVATPIPVSQQEMNKFYDVDDNLNDQQQNIKNTEIDDSYNEEEFSTEDAPINSRYDYESYWDNYDYYGSINNYYKKKWNSYDYYYDIQNKWRKSNKRYGYYGYYDIYGHDLESLYELFPFSNKIEFDKDGNIRNETLRIKDLNTYDIAFNGGPGKKKRNVIGKEIKAKLTKQKNVYPMSPLAQQITLWLTKQNTTVNWKKFSTKPYTYLNDDQYFDKHSRYIQKKNIRVLTTDTYASFLNEGHDSAILYIDLTEKSQLMLKQFLDAAEESLHTPFSKNLEFAIVNADYNYLEYTKKSDNDYILPLTFKSSLPFVAVMPLEWYNFVPFIADSFEQVDALISNYIERKKYQSIDEIISSYLMNETDFDKSSSLESLKNKVKNETLKDLFYWNFEFYRLNKD